jgi:hypothetical protein
LSRNWKYSGPIFDAHTHIVEIDGIAKMLAIEDEFGVTRQIGIVHSDAGFKAAKERYPERFVFAKYLSLKDFANLNPEPVLEEIHKIKDEGYTIAKAWFGPRWRDWYKVSPDFRINHPRLDPVFQELEDQGIPFLLHIGDPDTYYALQYNDTAKYGTKETHLSELEDILSRHRKLRFQIPHLGAQPEIARLPNLTRWLEEYPNVVLDTASSRWMARELSKDQVKAREFMLRFSDRILFGTDLFSDKDDRDFYSGRYVAQRILWETGERGVPLPFPDDDTKDIGGTFINGLDLPLPDLRKLYWENAERLYGA